MAQKATFRSFDVVELLDSPDAIAAYLNATMEEAGDDQTMVMRALDTAIRAQNRNLAAMARNAGMTRSGLYDALTGTQNPSLSTVLRLLHAMGLNLAVSPAKQS